MQQTPCIGANDFDGTLERPWLAFPRWSVGTMTPFTLYPSLLTLQRYGEKSLAILSLNLTGKGRLSICCRVRSCETFSIAW